MARSLQLVTSLACALFLCLLITCLATPAQAAPRIDEIDTPDIVRNYFRQNPNRIKNIDIIRGLLNDLGQTGHAQRLPDKRSRPECWINAGMSRACDYKDLMNAVEEDKYWHSADSPGKRRRRSLLGNFEPTVNKA